MSESKEYALEIDIEKQVERYRHNPKMRLHTHPALERQLQVPDGHVIIDKPVFDELFRIHGQFVTRNSVEAERDMLRRQVEVLATSLTEAANELVPYGGYSCQIEKWREQIRQAKNGGGGE